MASCKTPNSEANKDSDSSKKFSACMNFSAICNVHRTKPNAPPYARKIQSAPSKTTEINFNIILPSIPRFPKWPHLFTFFN